MDTKKEAGRRIAAARNALGMTLEDVCRQVPGLIFSRLSNWEHGRNMIGADEAKKLAPVLGVTAAYLLTLEDAVDEKERVLIEYYRHSDERGRNQILRCAESESHYLTDEDLARSA